MSNKGEKILVTFKDGTSKVFPGISLCCQALHIDNSTARELIETGSEWKPKQTKYKENIGMTLDYAL